VQTLLPSVNLCITPTAAVLLCCLPLHCYFSNLQVAGSLPAQQQVQTLTSIVKLAAADHIPLAAVMQPQRLDLLAQLLHAEPAIAVLAAEVLCRVCSQDLGHYGSQLVQLVPDLLAVVEQCSSSCSCSCSSSTSAVSDPAADINSSSSSDAQAWQDATEHQKQCLPLLFFAVSALVRMSSDRQVAMAVVDGGGVPVLVHALRVSPPAVCQVRLVWCVWCCVQHCNNDCSYAYLWLVRACIC
jgi:hypothetical protein